jgi:hypothetical protein
VVVAHVHWLFTDWQKVQPGTAPQDWLVPDVCARVQGLAGCGCCGVLSIFVGFGQVFLCEFFLL